MAVSPDALLVGHVPTRGGACGWIAIDLSRKNPQRETELKFKLRNSPAHMAVRQGDFQLLRWLDTYIFFIKGNSELNRLHKTWLGEPMGDIPVL